MAIRLSYALVSVAPLWSEAHIEMFKIHIAYASGLSRSLPQRFENAKDAEAFIARFYPELVGKCTAAGTSTHRPDGEQIA